MTSVQRPEEGRTADEDVILEISDASVTFDMERGASRVLDTVNLSLRRDEILGVVGESGSGKSMFASALLNAVVNPGNLTGEITYYPEAGDSVQVLDLSKDELKRLRWEEISMVFQGALSSFNPTMTIHGHVIETLEAHDADVDEGIDRAHEILTDLHLDPERVLDSYPHELSGGMKQRALIALSLILEPNVLVMDEPTAALDLLMQRSILNLLHKLQQKYSLTLVFITHDLPLVAGLANRLAVMYAFEFVEVGDTAEIIRNAAHPYTRALLRSTPNLNTPLADMEPIEGRSPDPVEPPSGCSYHPRCPLATEECETDDPPFYEVSDGHTSACHHWTEAADELPLHWGDRPTSTETSTPAASARTGEEQPVVSLRDVEVHFETANRLLDLFSSGDAVRAVDGITLDIYENDVVALVGESGCGKTTLGKTAIGIQRPTGGTVEYRGQDVWDAKDGRGDVAIPFDEIRESLQIIHQDPGSSLNPNRTVQAILSVPLQQRASEMSTRERREQIHTMLEYVGMAPAEDYAQRYPHQLSGGEKQRVALVRALFMNPDLILADEAVSALDVSLRVEIMDLMLELQDLFGTSYVFVSHNFSNARYLAQKAGGRIGVMYLGELVEIGPANELLENPRHPYTKALRWAALEIDPETAGKMGVEAPPLRSVDIPDPVDPPSGCRFHTRCPEAREVCTRQTPPMYDTESERHEAACFRNDEDHEYWDSEPLYEDRARSD